jgi:hypothetical protein
MNYSTQRTRRKNAKDAKELLFAAFARNSAPFALNNSFDSAPLSFYTFTLVGEFQTFEAKPSVAALHKKSSHPREVGGRFKSDLQIGTCLFLKFHQREVGGMVQVQPRLRNNDGNRQDLNDPATLPWWDSVTSSVRVFVERI